MADRMSIAEATFFGYKPKTFPTGECIGCGRRLATTSKFPHTRSLLRHHNGPDGDACLETQAVYGSVEIDFEREYRLQRERELMAQKAS